MATRAASPKAISRMVSQVGPPVCQAKGGFSLAG
jgi:hypothetical protein